MLIQARNTSDTAFKPLLIYATIKRKNNVCGLKFEKESKNCLQCWDIWKEMPPRMFMTSLNHQAPTTIHVLLNNWHHLLEFWKEPKLLIRQFETIIWGSQKKLWPLVQLLKNMMEPTEFDLNILVYNFFFLLMDFLFYLHFHKNQQMLLKRKTCLNHLSNCLTSI